MKILKTLSELNMRLWQMLGQLLQKLKELANPMLVKFKSSQSWSKEPKLQEKMNKLELLKKQKKPSKKGEKKNEKQKRPRGRPRKN